MIVHADAPTAADLAVYSISGRLVRRLKGADSNLLRRQPTALVVIASAARRGRPSAGG
jgi:hypothetical protein